MDIDIKFLFRGYSHKEWAEITGLSYRMLVKLAGENCPAYRRKHWWPIPFALWTAGMIETKQRGRKRLIDANTPIKIESVIAKLSEKYAKINQSNS